MLTCLSCSDHINYLAAVSQQNMLTKYSQGNNNTFFFFFFGSGGHVLNQGSTHKLSMAAHHLTGFPDWVANAATTRHQFVNATTEDDLC